VKNPPTVKTGDRVRIVLEGVADIPLPDSTGFTISEWTFISPQMQHVVSVEVLAKQFKVGDTVSGDDFAKLPVGTGVAHPSNGRPGLHVKSAPDSWSCAEGNKQWRDGNMQAPRTIVYLP
jgi:hypothetical protein